MSDERNARGLLHGITGVFGRAPGRAESKGTREEGYAESAEALGSLLAELKRRVEERRAAEHRHSAAISGRLTGLDEEDAQEVRQSRLAEVHARIRKDVLAMHDALGTGVGAEALTRLDQEMREMCDIMDVSISAGVEPYVAAMVTRRFFDETGPPAWSRLMDLMGARNIEWPSPDPFTRDHRRAEAEEMFLHASPQVITSLLNGVVSVWQEHYPQPDSSLWESVRLRACGAAIRVQMIVRGIEYVRAHLAELKAQGEALLREEIEIVKQAVDSGVRSIESADRLVAGAGGVLEQILPELCWKAAREKVMAES